MGLGLSVPLSSYYFVVTKFADGAWLILILIPVLVLSSVFIGIIAVWLRTFR
jgi:hypothetical protein